MSKSLTNNAYIDDANLYNGLKNLGWAVDYKRFRVWLKDKYAIRNAYIFTGFIQKFKGRYEYLRECGFIVIFKEILHTKEGSIKGNCDAELVLKAVRDSYEEEFETAVIVSSDGDYSCLVRFLQERRQLKVVLSPYAENKCSILLKRTNAPISYLNNQRGSLER